MNDQKQNTPNVVCEADRPARFKKAVVFNCDENYVPYAAHAAAQIVDIQKERDFDICICGDLDAKIDIPDTLKHLELRSCNVDVGQAFDEMLHASVRASIVYLRLVMPQAFAGQYDRILYLDSDIFIQGGNFSELLDLEIGEHAIAAVRDNRQWRTPNRRVKSAEVKQNPGYKYFNAGVMLMDVKNYLQREVLENCTELGQRERKNDQDLYNTVLRGDWAEISPMWNWQFSRSARLFSTLVSPHILHFIGPAKPWNDKDCQFEPRFMSSFRSFIGTHFPDFDLPSDPVNRLAPDSTMVSKMLVKHLLSRKKMARYLDRFPSDMTVHL